MVEKHNHINFRVLADLGVKFEVSDDGVKSAETAAKIVKAKGQRNAALCRGPTQV